ncbi:hypothetical protein LSH36_876g00022 [Paralvinella palmiformis]|uniref:Uncharacterized protein n=1 Tax=Paralvinella palmiformis TaxID=53620 RepID=A0AAD9MRU5_9ANNE|nr:hypothetical protein LSH36_876g00022 [Paralvinella palmiformis]
MSANGDDVSEVTACDGHTMTSLEHDDAIEIISSHADSTPITDTAYTMFTSVDAASVDLELPPTSGSREALSEDRIKVLARERCLTKTPPPSKKQKRIKRAVMVVGTLLITMSLILVGVTLYMSEHIDEMGKWIVTTTTTTTHMMTNKTPMK